MDLAGGRDDPASGGESPVYISAIHKVRKGEGADKTGGRDYLYFLYSNGKKRCGSRLGCRQVLSSQ